MEWGQGWESPAPQTLLLRSLRARSSRCLPSHYTGCGSPDGHDLLLSLSYPVCTRGTRHLPPGVAARIRWDHVQTVLLCHLSRDFVIHSPAGPAWGFVGNSWGDLPKLISVFREFSSSLEHLGPILPKPLGDRL